MKQQLRVSAGDLLQIKRADVVVGEGIAEVNGPPGRYLVVMALGVTDKNVPFQIEDMLRALGYQPIPKKEESDGN